MAALSPDSTARLWVDYTHRGLAHSIMLRFPTGSQAAAAAGVFRQVIAANTGAFYSGTQFTGARVAEVGTNVSNPIPFQTISGTQEGSGPPEFAGLSYGLVGRDTDGHKARWFFFGAYSGVALPADFRHQFGESPRLDDLAADFRDFADEVGLTTVGGQAPVIASYWNVRLNGYRQRTARL